VLLVEMVPGSTSIALPSIVTYFIYAFNVKRFTTFSFLTFDSTYTITLETKCFTFSKGSANKMVCFYFSGKRT
jgi:hypothetical protein